MAGDLSNRRREPGEKPVINEEFNDRFVDKPVKRVEEAPAKKTEKKPSNTQGLKDGIRLFGMKRWENALKELLLVDDADFSGEDQAELAYYLGLCYAKLERFDDARKYLEKVVAASGDLLRTYQCRLTLAYIYVTTGYVKLAEFELNELQSSGFESAPLYNTLAYAAYTKKQYRKAIDFYEKALDLDTDNATALNSVGYILADTGMDPMRGLRYCRKALEQRPQSAAYLDSLGWAYYKCGNLSDARHFLRKAMEFAPKEKEIKEHFRIVSGGSA